MHYDLRYYELKHIRKGIAQVVKFLLICQTHNVFTFTFFIQHQKNLVIIEQLLKNKALVL